MKVWAVAAVAAVLAIGAPAHADNFSIGIGGGGVAFSYDSGGYCDRWGCPDEYWDMPVYDCPVFWRGEWYRGPVYYRRSGGRVWYWLHGGWRYDEWRGPRPSWACVSRYRPALGFRYYEDNGFRIREDWRRHWYERHRNERGWDRNDRGWDHRDGGWDRRDGDRDRRDWDRDHRDWNRDQGRDRRDGDHNRDRQGDRPNNWQDNNGPGRDGHKGANNNGPQPGGNNWQGSNRGPQPGNQNNYPGGRPQSGLPGMQPPPSNSAPVVTPPSNPRNNQNGGHGDNEGRPRAANPPAANPPASPTGNVSNGGPVRGEAGRGDHRGGDNGPRQDRTRPNSD